MAGSTLHAIRDDFAPTLRIGSRVLHNRIDQFIDCFVRNAYLPIGWQDIAHLIRPNIKPNELADLRLYIANQHRPSIGRHAIDFDLTFFEALSRLPSPLIVIDNYMDIASKLLVGKRVKCKGFLNWSAIRSDLIEQSFEVVDYIKPSDYLDCLQALLSYFRIFSPGSRIALILFPSIVETHNDRHAILNSKMLNEFLLPCLGPLAEKYNCYVHYATPVSCDDLVNAEDWSHYSKSYYRHIANDIINGLADLEIKNTTDARLSDLSELSCLPASVHQQPLSTSFTVSVVIQFFQDFDHIMDVINAISWADEIIINDGPFRFAQPIFANILDSEDYYKESSSRFFADIARRDGINIIYIYGAHDDERHKRIFGYAKATCDIVLSVDADEILDLSRDGLRPFVSSSAVVGMFECVNLTYYNLCISKHLPMVDGLFPNKPFAFKRNLVGDNRHIDYLWLVGTSQAEVSTSDFLLKPLCRGLHFTNVRSQRGALVKFGFYTALAWKDSSNSPRHGPYADCQYYFTPPNGFSTLQKCDILSKALPASVGFPEGFALQKHDEIMSSYLSTVAKNKLVDFQPFVLSGNMTCSLLPGIPAFLHICTFESLSIYCDYEVPVKVCLHAYRVGLPSEQTHISGDPFSFSATTNAPVVIENALIKPASQECNSLACDLDCSVFYLLEICCWAGDDIKAKIRESGLPIHVSLHVC